MKTEIENAMLAKDSAIEVNSVDEAILNLEQEVRGWSLIMSNLIRLGAPLRVLKYTYNEVSILVKEINRLTTSHKF